MGVRHAVGVGSGTDGLLLSLMALDVGPGDEVITSPFTFFATAGVIALLGARPVFVDIDPVTFNLDHVKLGDLLDAACKQGRRFKAIMPVSLYGQCADMDEIGKVASQYGIPVVEDACQSFGATYKARRSCGLSGMEVTSFYPTKPLGCYGDGGMVFTDDDLIAGRLKSLRNHGQKDRYRHEEIGLNARLDAVQAAVLLVRFSHFEDELPLRQAAATRYEALLSEFQSHVKTPLVLSGRTSVFAQYTIRVAPEGRDGLARSLSEKGIPTAIHYPVPLHIQPAFCYLGIQKGSLPEAESAANEVLSLPIHPFITEGEQVAVVQAIGEYYGVV